MAYSKEVLENSSELLLAIRHDLAPIVTGAEYIRNHIKGNSEDPMAVRMGELIYSKITSVLLEIEKGIQETKNE